MIVLDVNRLGRNFGYEQLFEDVSFSLNEGESISIVGPNGCGKSTMLKIIAGLERADSGTVSIKKGAKVAYIDQTASSIDDDRTVYEILRGSFGELSQMETRLDQLSAMLESDLSEEEYNRVLERYCSLLEKFGQNGGYEMDTEIEKVLGGLNIDRDLVQQSYNSLSGGEKTLVQLAKALLIKPDLLLLDEPTNHLDIDRIEWLENYIKSFKGASVIVSHDRYFLDRMSSKILDLESVNGKVYTTNYSGYLVEKERDFEKQMEDYKDQQALIKKLEAQKKYFSERGMATNSSTLCDRAHVIQAQIERIKRNAIARPKKQRKLNVGFNEEGKSSKRVIATEQLTVETPDGKTILDHIDLDIRAGERVAIIGKNGSGKTTLIRSIMGEQELPVQGDIIIGPSVEIGYLPQIIDFPDDEEKLLDYFRKSVGLDEQRARQILAGFQFYQEDVNKRVKNLSGGERMRIKLAELLQQKINTLIFDEPTNHIDIPTREVLEEALQDFDGTIIFVSHDRYFINKFADRTVEFENGKANIYLGNYDDYREKKSGKRSDDINSEDSTSIQKKSGRRKKGRNRDYER